MPNPFRRMLRHTINAKISIKALVLIAIIVLLVRKDEGYQSLTLEGHRLYGDIPPMEPDVGKGCSLPVLPDHTCPFLRKQEHKGRIVYTKLLADACKKGVADVCFVPFSMKHRKQLVPISLPALLKRLASVGGAECFSGPLRKGDLVMSRVTGIHGEPLYSVYHKSCEGRYRDLSRLEILSVLYHYTNLANIGGGKLQRGLFLHGDSMIQNFGEVFWSVLRGQEHHVQNRGLNIFIMYRDHDETFELPDKFADENVSLPVHLQCVLEEFHAGSLLNPTITSSDCQVHVQDIIMTVLVKRDRYPEDPSYGFLRRTSRAAVSYHSFNYWWDQENPPAQSIEDLTRSYLKFEEFQYESHFSDPTVNATPSDTLNIPPLLFLYGTSPKREGAEYAPWRIDEALVSRRNTFLRTLQWQRHPRARVYSLFGDNHNQSSNIPVRRYLIDFAVIKEFLSDVAHTTDRTHFTCSDEKFIVRDGFFCVDAMNYVQIQWISHIVASELLFSVFPKG